MSIVKLRRVSLHPWVWWTIVRRALVAFTSGELNVESRRRMASILDTLDDALDPDDVIMECPYARLSRHETQRREKRNAEIEAEREKTGEDPRFVRERAVGGTLVPGFMPLPRPDWRVRAHFSDPDLAIVKRAVETFAARPDLTQDLSRGFVDAVDAFDAAERVEVEADAAHASSPRR